MKARLFDGISSGFTEAELKFQNDRLLIHTHDTQYSFKTDEVHFSDRLGNMPRSLALPDGKVCECDDNDAIDVALKDCGLHKSSRLIHILESKSIFVLPALAVTIGLIFVFISYILPYSAQKIAYSIPQEIATSIGTGTLQTLDKLVLKPSRLDGQKKDEITRKFKQMSEQLQDLPPLNLVFRSAEKIGPNAFALPDGTIVMTDELVLLSENNEELLSILAHEIGHVKNRHAIRMLLQNSVLLVLITTFTGDATTASAAVSALPTLLIESSFSRELESEADDYAIEVMQARSIPLHYFADIMQRLSLGREDDDEAGEYFSSHPITSSRIAKFKAQEKPQ